MKKHMSVGVVVALMFAISATSFPASLFAETVTLSKLQERITALTAPRANPTQQVSPDTSVSAPPASIAVSLLPRVCTLLTRNLGMGAYGDDVRGLQEFLQGEGHFKVVPTGYFGPLTSRAVAEWQNAHGVTPLGVFGPLSRGRLITWCGEVGVTPTPQGLQATPTQGATPLTVTFSTRLSGFHSSSISYLLDFGDGSSVAPANCLAPADACIASGTDTHTYTQNGTYTATLSQITDPCSGNRMCKAPIQYEVLGTVVITVGKPVACTREYAPVCGQPSGCADTCPKGMYCTMLCRIPDPVTYSNACLRDAAGATPIHTGICTATSSGALI